MKKLIITLSSFAVIILLLTITRAVVSNSLSTSGVDLTRLSQEIDAYKRETAILEEKTLQASSYTTLQEEAGKRGYEPMSGQLVFSSQLPFAYKK